MSIVEAAGRPATSISIRDRLLFALTLSSGAVDAISFLALGKVFTAFVTGNIAFLGLAIAQDPRAPSIAAVLAAMAGFAAGIYLATRIVSLPESSAACLDQKQLDPVWPRRTTYALALSLLPHLGFALVWAGDGCSARRQCDPRSIGLVVVRHGHAERGGSAAECGWHIYDRRNRDLHLLGGRLCQRAADS